MEHKAKIILATDVYKQIEWLTRNFDKEIGAVGKGKVKTEDGEKFFYIDKLFFPQQTTSSASVHITPEMWGTLIKDPEFVENLGNIRFYWHKHPGGNPAHSQTDEEESYEQFMADESNSKWFCFLQTALKGNEIVTESRIDIRNPVRATILDAGINLTYEVPDEDKRIENECVDIISKCIVNNSATKIKEIVIEDTITEKDMIDMLTSDNDEEYMDNDMIGDIPTSDEEKASLDFKNGKAVVKTGKLFKAVINSALEKSGKLFNIVKHKSVRTDTQLTMYDLQPHKKKHRELETTLKSLFVKYNNYLLTKISDIYEEENGDTKPKINPNPDKYMIADRLYEVANAISVLQTDYNIIWTKPYYATIRNLAGGWLGNILVTEKYNTLTVTGPPLIKIVKQIREDNKFSNDKNDFAKNDFTSPSNGGPNYVG